MEQGSDPGERRVTVTSSVPVQARAIDTFVNVNMGSGAKPEWLKRVAADYFQRSAQIFVDFEPDQLVEIMDRCGVEKSVVTVRAHEIDERVLEFPRKYPDRFVLSASVDPRRGMKMVAELEALFANEPLVLARIVPFMIGIAPNERENYPIYAKCCELGLPISVNTGIPGPPAPARVQDPLHLDDVCLFFPDLVLIMAHGADPWWNVAIRLMLKYQNLYLMTSAFAPRYLPAELVHYMNTRGQHKIMFASDHPVLAMERCVEEARAMDLRDGVLEKFLYDNAHRVLIEPRL
ncbi:MAG: putative TIM-barrel fold metal-dependent hydrolase [Myxococcota bacterium]|jgi:predicted TIM-barrel fold metal-dependent hydrolase